MKSRAQKRSVQAGMTQGPGEQRDVRRKREELKDSDGNKHHLLVRLMSELNIGWLEF